VVGFGWLRIFSVVHISGCWLFAFVFTFTNSFSISRFQAVEGCEGIGWVGSEGNGLV